MKNRIHKLEETSWGIQLLVNALINEDLLGQIKNNIPKISQLL
jgi:hypothetical protein